jgi:hypothetical protein
MKLIPTFLMVLLGFVCVMAGDTSLDENLAPLGQFFGTWRGEFKSSTPEKPLVDVSLWERALNGKAVRIVHSINQGAYGGETFVTWDAAKKEIVYHYFTTAGFLTKGTMKVDGKKLICHESITGNAGEATEVQSTYELRPDGSLESRATYLKSGSSVGGREVTYKRVDGIRPAFK